MQTKRKSENSRYRQVSLLVNQTNLGSNSICSTSWLCDLTQVTSPL